MSFLFVLLSNSFLYEEADFQCTDWCSAAFPSVSCFNSATHLGFGLWQQLDGDEALDSAGTREATDAHDGTFAQRALAPSREGLVRILLLLVEGFGVRVYGWTSGVGALLCRLGRPPVIAVCLT